jgi:hypothetical protein
MTRFKLHMLYSIQQRNDCELYIWKDAKQSGCDVLQGMVPHQYFLGGT